MPDATGLLPGGPDARPVRLFDLLRGSTWTLLGFGATPAPPRPDVRTIEIVPAGAAAGDSPARVVDTGEHAYDAWAPVDGELVLVRPDGHVGIRATDPDVVRCYLSRVCPSGSEDAAESATSPRRVATRSSTSPTPVMGAPVSVRR